MSSTTRLQVVFSIYKSQWVGPIVEKLLSALESAGSSAGSSNPQSHIPPFVFLHFPSRVLPSTWGGGLGSRGAGSDSRPAAGAKADADVLSPSQLEALHSLLRSGKVALLPAGYSGAMHPLLHPDEIAHDAEWGLSNPWRSGFKDHFGNAEPVFLPFWPEVTRPRPSDASAYTWWCEGVFGSGKESKLVFSQISGQHRSLAYLRVPDTANATQIDKSLRQIGDETGPVFMHFAPAPEHFNEQLRALNDPAFKHFSFGNDFAILENAAHFDMPKPAHISGSRAAPLSPGFRSKIGQFPSLRKSHIGGQERLRGLLIDADPEAKNDGIPNQAEPERKQRSLLAAMQGNAVLMADNFEAEFQTGHLVAFKLGEERIPFRCEPGADMRFSHIQKSFETESAVSFETDQTRGMRQSLRFVHTECKFPGRSIVDYFVADRSPHLLVDFSLRHPWFEKETLIESVTPLRFAIDLPEHCTQAHIERVHSDGSVFSTSFDLAAETREHPTISAAKNLLDHLLRREKSEDPKTIFLPGSRWVVRWQSQGKERGIMISSLDFEYGIGLPLELQIVRGEKPRILLSPEGSYRNIASDELVGLSQRLSLAVYPIFDAMAELPAPDTFAERELSPSYIIRQK